MIFVILLRFFSRFSFTCLNSLRFFLNVCEIVSNDMPLSSANALNMISMLKLFRTSKALLMIFISRAFEGTIHFSIERTILRE